MSRTRSSDPGSVSTIWTSTPSGHLSQIPLGGSGKDHVLAHSGHTLQRTLKPPTALESVITGPWLTGGASGVGGNIGGGGFTSGIPAGGGFALATVGGGLAEDAGAAP